MFILEICFWCAAGLMAYSLVGYPLALALWARLRPRPVLRAPYRPRFVSFLVAARDEVGAVAGRLTELTDLLDRAGLEGEVILVSDGSTDGTAAAARACAEGPVRVLELPEPQGKAAALTAAFAAARGEILVLADIRQRWAPDALTELLANFHDPEVGAVTGNLILEKSPGVLAGVGLYWKYEKWIRRQESRTFAMVGATGAISAVRAELFHPIPPGTLLDDVYWPLRVAMQGRRVVLEPEARAYDRLPGRTLDEFRRKVRTLSGNYQLLTLLPAALLPWRNPICWQFISHKLLRLAGPWLLAALLLLSAVLPGPVYLSLFVAQVVGYLFALLGLAMPTTRRRGLLSAAASFLVLNAAAGAAFWVWVSGQTARSWNQVHYAVPVTPAAPAKRAETLAGVGE